MAVCWRSVTLYVILLHRPSAPVTPVLGIQKMIRMAAEGFYRREVDKMPYFDFSTEKFMFKRTWQVVFWGARNYFRHPKTTCRSPEGSGRAPLQSRCAWKRKKRNKNLKNGRCNIQTGSQKRLLLKKAIYNFPCLISTATCIFSSYWTVWLNLCTQGGDHDRLYNHLHPTQWQTLRKLPV